MKNTIKILLVFIATLFAGKTKAIDFVVSNAFHAPFNGTYTQMESCNLGFPIYTRSSGGINYVLYSNSTTWYLATYTSHPCAPIFNFNTYCSGLSTNNFPASSGWQSPFSGPVSLTVTMVAVPFLTYSRTNFVESITNNGNTTTSINISHNKHGGVTFTGSNNDNFITAGKVVVNNIPAGLTPSIIRINDSTLTFTLNGSASAHANDISNLNVVFQNTAFSNNNAAAHTNYSFNTSIDFINQLNVGTGQTYTTIASAIAAANTNDILNLAAQTFTESNLQINKPLSIFGQGASTIVQAHANPSTATNRVFNDSFFIYSVQNVVNFDKLTIKNGYFRMTDTEQGGGGINTYNSSLNITNCSFEGNNVYCYYSYQGIGGGALAAYKSYVTVSNSTFYNNRFIGGFTGTFMGGGAINSYGNYSFTATNCTFSFNHAGNSHSGGGGICATAGTYNPVTITNCTFSENTGRYGGGFSGLGQGVALVNSIFYGNSATVAGADIYSSANSTWGIGNCLFPSNGDKGGITGLFVGTVIGNPLLGTLADNGGYTKTYSIPANSPAVNAGSSLYSSVPINDQRGLAVVSTKDIGAYEHIPPVYYSQASGNPATLSNWNTAANGSGSAPASLILATTYIIQNGHTLTTTGALTFGASGSTLQIRNGGTLTANHIITMASGSNYQIDVGGTFNSNVNQTINSINLIGGKLNIAPNTTLTINGTINITEGVIGGSSTSNLIIGTEQSIFSRPFLFDQTTPGTTNVIQNLTIGTGTNASLLIGNALIIAPTGSITFNALGTKSLITGGNLTLKSSATSSASIGNLNGGNISGNVTVERFVSGQSNRGRWRFLSSPVQSATVANWMSQFYVTGPGDSVPANRVNGSTLGTLNTNGWHTNMANILFPNSTMNSNLNSVKTTSIRTYNEQIITGNINSGWENLSSSSQVLTPGRGFRTFIRGNNNIANAANIQLGAGANTNLQGAVNLTLTGEVNQGEINANPTFTSSGTIGNDGWNLIGNPYACSYNLFAHINAPSNSAFFANISPTVWVYSAVTGGYVSYNTAGSGTNGGLDNGIIPPGAAFFIKATSANPVFRFREAYKTTNSHLTGGVHKTTIKTEEFGIKYYQDSTENDYTVIKMYDGATLNNDVYDIVKVRNDNLNLAAYGTDSVNLTASVIPPIVEETRIKLNVEATQIGTYHFEFTNMEHFEKDITVNLYDRFTNKTMDVRKQTKYTFAMDAGVNQWGNNRFELILNKTTTSNEDLSNKISNTTLLVYPNPATDVLNINISNANFKNSEIVVYNISGAEVLKTNMASSNAQLNIANLCNGVYLLKVTNQNGFNKTVKFVK